TNVVRVHIVNLVFEDREGTLLARLEVHVGCDDPNLIGAGDGSIVVSPRRDAVDIEPRANDVDGFGEVDCDTRIARRVDAVFARIATKYGWTNLDDRCSAPRIWSS